MIVGLEDVTEGTIRIDDEDITDKAPRDRNLAMVFQDYALYPHLTVRENMEFPLKLRKMSTRQDIERAGSNAPPSRSSSGTCSTASRRTSPAVSASGSRWAGRSCGSRPRSCSTSRSRTSTPSCGSRCAARSPISSAG